MTPEQAAQNIRSLIAAHPMTEEQRTILIASLALLKSFIPKDDKAPEQK